LAAQILGFHPAPFVVGPLHTKTQKILHGTLAVENCQLHGTLGEEVGHNCWGDPALHAAIEKFEAASDIQHMALPCELRYSQGLKSNLIHIKKRHSILFLWKEDAHTVAGLVVAADSDEDMQDAIQKSNLPMYAKQPALSASDIAALRAEIFSLE
jgi:hypothetical protein